MTAEVNSVAAADRCPVNHQGKGKHKPGSKSEAAKDESCGFNAEMMRVAQHSAGWTVNASAFDPRLSKSRVVSSIPKGDFTPAHQSGATSHWEYPSEDMYFKAMQRKGWDPEAGQMKTIVAIHNTINEQSWQEVLKWESFHPAQHPVKLKRFLGKPTEFSPKARIMNALGWSVLPFDRHDWVVDRDGHEVRYVIDFYSGQPEPGRPLSVYLDVRPALDSVDGVLDRLRWQFHEKIRPLLPFEGAFFRSKPAASDKASAAGASSTENSKVTPRSDGSA